MPQGLMLALALAAAAFSPPEFDAWARAHGRVYATAGERARRRALFDANMAEMAEVGARSPRAVYRAGDHADWSADELKGLRGGEADLTSPRARTANVTFSRADVDGAEDSLDWVARGAVTTPPRSQGRCGTCQEFSGSGDMEGAWVLDGGHDLARFSTQELIDCQGGASCARAKHLPHRPPPRARPNTTAPRAQTRWRGRSRTASCARRRTRSPTTPTPHSPAAAPRAT